MNPDTVARFTVALGHAKFARIWGVEIDDGSDQPGRRLSSAWVTLTQDEAWELIDALLDWSEIEDCERVPGWHAHVHGPDGTELTIAIEPTGVEPSSGPRDHSHP